MGMVMRVSLAGYNALTDNDPRHYSLFTDGDNVLIKEQSRGSGTVNNGTTAQITHSLGYSPHFYVYTQVSGNRYKLTNGYNIFGSWRAYVDSSKLYISNSSGANATARRFIFYDNID